MTETPEHLDLASPNLVHQNIEKIAALFPNCVTETANGIKIDFDLLQQELSEQIIEGSKERYRLEWPGKREAIVIANIPTNKTLRPVLEDSVNFDTTENLYIEGDNLEVLKLLQESYLGKVKMIYIDPPYNRGKDFIYKDDFTQNTEDFKAESGFVDEYNQRLVPNPDTSGRYHSDWLTMIYPRLKLARNLLKDNGIIFISIDDKEIQNLRKICDEIFGAKNFMACLIWNSEGNTDNQLEIKINHEYILCYLKDIDYKNKSIGYVIDPNTRSDSNLHEGFVDNNINKNGVANPPDIIELPIGFPSSEEELLYNKKILDDDFFTKTKAEKYISDEVKGKYDIENLSGLPVKIDDMIISDYKLQKPCRIYGGFANRNKLKEFIDNDFKPIDQDGTPISFYININAAVRYRKENVESRNILSVLRNLGTTEKSKTSLKNIGIDFSYPKPTDLISYLAKIGCYDKNSIILDFFSGSASTAHAVMQINMEDGRSRKHIMVQIPETIDEKSEAFKAGYQNICEIGKERIRRAGNKIVEEQKAKLAQLQAKSLVLNKKISVLNNPLFMDDNHEAEALIKEQGELQSQIKELAKRIENLDIGFRVYRLDSSNMKDVYYTPKRYSQETLDLFADNIKEDRSAEDLVAQIMLDWGLSLSMKIEKVQIAHKEVFKVAGDSLFACFDKDIDEGFAREIAKERPLRVVFRDSSFKGDKAKVNVFQLLKQLSPNTEMRVI